VWPDGDTVRLFDVHGDERLVSGDGRAGARHGDPPIQSVGPVDVAGRPVDRDAVDRRRRSRENDAQTERPVHRQLDEEPARSVSQSRSPAGSPYYAFLTTHRLYRELISTRSI